MNDDVRRDFEKIMEYAHFWNWLPDWNIAYSVYDEFPDSYSVLTPFAYTYLEEAIRAMTSEYGIEVLDENRNPRKRKVGIGLIRLAIDENRNNALLVAKLEELKNYFSTSSSTDRGDNRNSVNHGYMHPRFWTKESFEKLIHDIAMISEEINF